MYYIVSRSNFIVNHIEKKKKHDKLKIYHGLLRWSQRKGAKMKYRKATKPKKDKKIFHQTASSTKKINVSPKVMRGGIRL